MNIVISRPSQNDKVSITRVFSITMSDAFKKDRATIANNVMKNEIDKQINLLDQDFQSGGTVVFFLIARLGTHIVGTAAYGKPNSIVKKYLHVDFTHIPEVKSVYVLPQFQNKGIGTLLLKAIVEELKRKHIVEFCLDGGFKKSQGYWIAKLGQPTITLNDYWGKGSHHMIWHRKIKDVYL